MAFDIYNFTDNDGVIAAIMTLSNLTLDVAQDAVDDRRAVAAGAPLQPGELVGAFGGEAARDLFLPFAQKIHRKAVLQFEARIARRALCRR